MDDHIKKAIQKGATSLGIELGSTRLKAVLIDDDFNMIASSSHRWENQFIADNWTYEQKDIWTSIQAVYHSLKAAVKQSFGLTLIRIGSIGISGMMHGYLVFDKNENLLTPFRTWRNVNAAYAAKQLTDIFSYPIPARWSIAHLYQAILNSESHIKNIAYLTTLAGYVHWQLTGEKVVGIGDASGMFPINKTTKAFDDIHLKTFDNIISNNHIEWKISNILPTILSAGEHAGYLTETGAILLDPQGDLKHNIPFCPPEGDAGTGMVATNSIKPKTGNISAGTSIFGMFVLENNLRYVHPEIDIVTTPIGDLVAMVHCNNGTSEINEWMQLFESVLNTFNMNVSKDDLFDKLFNESMKRDYKTDGLIIYPYVSGEHITNVSEGSPMMIRQMGSKLKLSSFMRAHIYASIATLKIGIDILLKKEQLQLEKVFVHGGLFKAGDAGEKLLASAIKTPISTLSNCGEGGAWGMAILAKFMMRDTKISLTEYLEKKVFTSDLINTVEPDAFFVQEFDQYMKKFKAGLILEKKAKEF